MWWGAGQLSVQTPRLILHVGRRPSWGGTAAPAVPPGSVLRGTLVPASITFRKASAAMKLMVAAPVERTPAEAWAAPAAPETREAAETARRPMPSVAWQERHAVSVRGGVAGGSVVLTWGDGGKFEQPVPVGDSPGLTK